jgi:hypothetical protein
VRQRCLHEALATDHLGTPEADVTGQKAYGLPDVAAASGSKNHARVIYLRGYGRGLTGMGVVACSKGIASIGSKSTQFSHLSSGHLYRLRMPFRGDCQVTASLSGSGRIRLQILAG